MVNRDGKIGMTTVKGWAYMPGTNSTDYRIEIGTASGDALVLYDTVRSLRPDVSSSFPLTNAHLTGFYTEIPGEVEREKLYVALTDLRAPDKGPVIKNITC